MKSTEAYAALKNELATPLAASGFKRGKSFLSWSRPSGGQHTVVWCQVSRDGWDDFAGSRFVVEFQRSSEPVVGVRSSLRQRIGALLSDADLEEARRIQNRVISQLQSPPTSHPSLHVSPEVTKWYLQKFAPQHEPFQSGSDLWLRYASRDHVVLWGRFLSERLVACAERIESSTTNSAALPSTTNQR